MAKHVSRWIAAGAVAVATTLGATALASAEGTPADNSTAPPAVEDFTYPGPAPYSNVKLLRGDGHILLSDCAVDDQIKVLSMDLPNESGNQICFRAATNTGYLALEVPNVIRIRTDDYAVSAKLTSEGVSQTIDIAKGPGGASVGIGSGTGTGKPAALLELRIIG
ncbi:hypothetical protein [Streptomyces sp. 1331.2]|uniref:hypothetical protein n=1 Tax=Streptomyces sp. 1331.2 TaxID=1938835 RepID=UPI000BCAE936|nr:hypothetical protein [Streptomyces sp. 1331.2]SOB85518.1 hypothetical protein SAMN06272789_5806 [Streptomyces sp. 1331.2]